MDTSSIVVDGSPFLIAVLVLLLVSLIVQTLRLRKAKQHIQALEHELNMLRKAKAMDEREIKRLKHKIERSTNMEHNAYRREGRRT